MSADEELWTEEPDQEVVLDSEFEEEEDFAYEHDQRTCVECAGTGRD